MIRIPKTITVSTKMGRKLHIRTVENGREVVQPEIELRQNASAKKAWPCGSTDGTFLSQALQTELLYQILNKNYKNF